MKTNRSPYFSRFLRPGLLALTLVTVGVVMTVPPLVQTVEAKRRKKKKKKKRGGSRASIKREADLSPKRDIELDDTITETDDLKPAAEDDGPSLKISDLSASENEQLLDEKLDEEIELARNLVKFETECEKISEVRARMAELYWTKSKRAFFKSQDFNISEEKRKKFSSVEKKLQNRTVQNYQEIVDKCLDYSDYAKMLYNLGRTLVEIGRSREGAQYFKRIIKEYPENEEWTAQAWFMVGEFYYNEEQDARKAFKAYERAAEFTASPIYGFAIYKQGWCHINTGDWDLAVDSFQNVIRISDDPGQNLDNKGRLSLRKEALKDYVRAWSHVGDSGDAYRTFTRVGGKDAVPGMMEKLGSWYVNRDNHSDVIAVYSDLIKYFKTSTRKPIFQGRIVNAADKQGDDKVTIKQVKLLTKYFKETRARLSKKMSKDKRERISKDIHEAEDLAENTLRRLALARHKEAKKFPEGSKSQVRSYKNAHELYKHYLEVFPEPRANATVNYVFFMRYYFAEVLYFLAQLSSGSDATDKFLEAAKNYDIVLAMNPNPEKKREQQIIAQAAEDSVRAYDEVVQDIHRKNPPEVSGDEAKPIPEIEQRLIAACRRYISYSKDFKEKLGRIVEIRYKMARIYYTYNHFDQAAPAFDDIVANHADNDVACYSANLALDIYSYSKNYAKLRKLARGYLRNDQLKGSCERSSDDDEFAKFRGIEEAATFELIKSKLEKGKKYVAAGNAYMDFYRQYGKDGDSKYAIDAVYNAAVNYDLGQRLDKANEVREFLVKQFATSQDPEHKKLVSETMYNIAQSFERVVDFQKAAEYLERFAQKYPKDERTKNAIYNAGLYRSTLRDYVGGRGARQRFLSLYKSDKDAHNVKFAMCESIEDEARQMEKQKDRNAPKKWEAAHDCYFDWVKNKDYTKRSTDMLCVAQFRRGEIMRNKTKYTKGYVEQRKYLLKSWPAWDKKEGKDKLGRCATAISEIMFRDLAPEMKKYRDLRISELNPTDRGKKAFDKSIVAKVKIRDDLIVKYKDIAAIGVPEWALASLFMIGEAYRNSIDRLLQAPIPDKIPGYKLTNDDKKALRAELEKLAVPIRDSAVDAYATCVDNANRLGVYNKWSVRALGALQKLAPEQYLPFVERIAAVDFKDEIVVERNGVVITEGERLKPLAQKLESTLR